MQGRFGSPARLAKLKVSSMSHTRIAVMVLMAATLAGCGDPKPPAPQTIRPVRTVTVERPASGERINWP